MTAFTGPSGFSSWSPPTTNTYVRRGTSPKHYEQRAHTCTECVLEQLAEVWVTPDFEAFDCSGCGSVVCLYDAGADLDDEEGERVLEDEDGWYPERFGPRGMAS